MENKKKKIFLIIFVTLIFFSLSFGLISYFYKKTETENKIYQQKIKKITEILKKKEMPLEKFQFGSYPTLIENNFFEEVKSELIKEKIDFLLINLSEKNLKFFEQGNLKKSYLVLSIGKEGSFWETPAGFYQIEAKMKKAFSSMGQVWMPYSLQFQGNFFIHGWPYYSNGKPVSSEFSGGCIRLSTEDAKEIFEKVKVGTPILITEDDFRPDNFSYQLKIPEIDAKEYLVADLKNNFIFLEKDSEKIVPIGSITKLMTALVVCEYINLWKEIKIKESDLIFTSKPRLIPGQIYNSFDLLYLLLMESSNEAAKSLSRVLGEENFVEIMNKKTKNLGMRNTEFKDCWGGDPKNLSNAKDLFILAKYLYYNRKFILDISKGKIFPDLISKNFSDLKNFNCLYNEKNFIGGKIGKTKATKETSLSIFEIEFKKEKRPILILVLGSRDCCSDTKKILEWIVDNYE
ncbi:MAG: L,D-transpeptidase family protein [Patescibacteria group bacterium]|nr:L,D-transpeptidase family protein [Patescibacteria group bacterium]